mmetsp:Transcript_30060/g.63787  ORF Transcript_30060/g.63787 Transcript_30060/m.63787 type:complete len:271 (+) Transcript_30060:185-997(+)
MRRGDEGLGGCRESHRPADDGGGRPGGQPQEHRLGCSGGCCGCRRRRVRRRGGHEAGRRRWYLLGGTVGGGAPRLGVLLGQAVPPGAGIRPAPAEDRAPLLLSEPGPPAPPRVRGAQARVGRVLPDGRSQGPRQVQGEKGVLRAGQHVVLPAHRASRVLREAGRDRRRRRHNLPLGGERGGRDLRGQGGAVGGLCEGGAPPRRPQGGGVGGDGGGPDEDERGDQGRRRCGQGGQGVEGVREEDGKAEEEVRGSREGGHHCHGLEQRGRLA